MESPVTAIALSKLAFMDEAMFLTRNEEQPLAVGRWPGLLAPVAGDETDAKAFRLIKSTAFGPNTRSVI